MADFRLNARRASGSGLKPGRLRAAGIRGAWLLVLPAIAATAIAAERQPQQGYVQSDPLATVVQAVAGADARARLDFAVLIVESLVKAYETELAHAAAARVRDAAARQRLARWRQATDGFLVELREAEAALYVARRVEVHLDRQRQMLLLIDNRPLWVAWPRVDTQAQLERGIVAEFCRRHRCPPGTLGPVPIRPQATVDPGLAPFAAAATGGGTAGFEQDVLTRGTWLLSSRHPPSWQTDDGLRCEFSDLADRHRKEALCQAVAADLHVLAAALQVSIRGEHPVEWDALSFQALPDAGRHRVTVNGRGDYVQLPLPGLAAVDVDWAEAGRWLREQVKGQSVPATVVRERGVRGSVSGRPPP